MHFHRHADCRPTLTHLSRMHLHQHADSRYDHPETIPILSLISTRTPFLKSFGVVCICTSMPPADQRLLILSRMHLHQHVHSRYDHPETISNPSYVHRCISTSMPTPGATKVFLVAFPPGRRPPANSITNCSINKLYH